MYKIYITAGGKKDGVGSQVLSKILAILFCENHNFTYVHTPLAVLDYKDQDETGKKSYESGNGNKWVETWEKMLNIGQNFMKINEIKPDIVLDLTDVKRTNQIKKGESYLWKDFDPLPLIKKHTDNLRASVLFVIKEFPKINFYNNDLSDLVINDLKKSYKLTYKPQLRFTKDILNIVIHKRHTRGNKLKPDTNIKSKNTRVTLNQYYIDIIKNLDKKYTNRPRKFWIFSDGNKNDFPEFEYIYGNEAIIKNTSEPIKVTLMLKTDSQEAFNYFVNADILVLDKSSFGYVAGLYNDNIVIYNPYWDKQYNKWILYN